MEKEEYQKTDLDYKKMMSTLEAKWSGNFSAMASDFAFSSGGKGMWNTDLYVNRVDVMGLPTISIPILQPYIDKIVHPVRKHPPGMSVQSQDAQIEGLLNSILNGIERKSNSTEKYATALKCSATGGLGWIYATIENDEDHYGNYISIKSTNDPTSIMCDGNLASGEDASYACYRGFISSIAKRSAFERSLKNLLSVQWVFIIKVSG